jgi:hypothetical protein
MSPKSAYRERSQFVRQNDRIIPTQEKAGKGEVLRLGVSVCPCRSPDVPSLQGSLKTTVDAKADMEPNHASVQTLFSGLWLSREMARTATLLCQSQEEKRKVTD